MDIKEYDLENLLKTAFNENDIQHLIDKGLNIIPPSRREKNVPLPLFKSQMNLKDWFGIPDIIYSPKLYHEANILMGKVYVIELKIGLLSTKHLGQISRYISGVDYLLKKSSPNHQVKIKGILIGSSFYKKGYGANLLELVHLADMSGISLSQFELNYDGLWFYNPKSKDLINNIYREIYGE